ncbi:hypothetical protein MUY14_15570 [Amycolatopsis sp. FBCC-B4732]|uniref:hypothetical protein n=1 Tax=Amycolatopsis sp. FBCC-B4732 TaxID=3079339 RepID=UPI001FF1182F|nr:hypothetical protein [Amycolatopsis sp. FBCC-B4732]UOX91974.1 hypothetical protein MUY14_15570 [Amycolatopsis sp. FBCC-B4732]
MRAAPEREALDGRDPLPRRVRAGTITDAVHGDINTVHGGHQEIHRGLDARHVTKLVRTELDAARLPPAAKDAVHDALDEVDREVVHGGSARSTVTHARDLLRAAGGLGVPF